MTANNSLSTNLPESKTESKINSVITQTSTLPLKPLPVDKIIDKTLSLLIASLFFLLPLFFLPFTREFYAFNKLTLLIFVTGSSLILWTLKMWQQKTISFLQTPLDLPLLLFSLSFLAASLLVSPSKTEAFLDPQATTTILTLILLYLVIINNFKKKNLFLWLHNSLASACLLSLLALIQFFEPWNSTSAPLWLKSKIFTPAGSPLECLVFLALNLSLAISLFWKKLQQKNQRPAFFYLLSSLVISLGISLTLYKILPGQETNLILPPLKESWIIAIESFKRSPVFGIGPGNYLSAFNRFRSASFNQHPLWYSRFLRAANLPLEILTVSGSLTLASYIFLIIKIIPLWWKSYQSPQTDDYHFAVLAAIPLLFGLQLFLPINFFILVFLFFFSSFLSLQQTQKKPVSFQAEISSLVLCLLTTLLVATGFFFWGRIYSAEFYFKKSIDALSQNLGGEAYRYQIKAISLNPHSPLYRRLSSQTSFLLANALAGQSEKSEQDQNNILALIQQAIVQAKLAASLNPNDALNWENLAQIYRSLINVAQDADQWTLAAYQQLINTDPFNPQIRVGLGGLYFAFGAFEPAIRHFQDAISLKPDYANAWYNLAVAYDQQGGRERETFLALRQVLSLLPEDHPDRERILKEAETIRSLISPPPTEATPSAALKEEAAEPEKLATPSALPSPMIAPPVKLPEELGPETPTPTISPTLTPTPTVSPAPSPLPTLTPS